MSEFSIKLYTRTLYPHDRTTDKQKKKSNVAIHFTDTLYYSR